MAEISPDNLTEVGNWRCETAAPTTVIRRPPVAGILDRPKGAAGIGESVVNAPMIVVRAVLGPPTVDAIRRTPSMKTGGIFTKMVDDEIHCVTTATVPVPTS